MKKINFSWPVRLSDFSVDEVQGNFSRGKLKVFYKGETADHRYFSDEFAEELVKTLPYTPIVSYYDDQADDFVGHATEQQIFGIVDPCIEPTFEQDDDGITWCICDTVLYTERPDKVGELAKKIEGHSQSLELDPNSVKYVINYDEKKHFKNIEFTAGKFVGVSVLGKDQQPAFTGSAFFSADAIAEKIKIISEYCEKSHDQSQNGGKEMNLSEFIKLTWGDICEKVSNTIWNEYANDAYTYIVDMYDDSAIVKFYYYIGESKLMKVNYTVTESGDIELGNVVEVIATYVEKEPQPQPEATTVSSMNSNDIPQVGDPSQEAMNSDVNQMTDASDNQLSNEDVNTTTTDVGQTDFSEGASSAAEDNPDSASQEPSANVTVDAPKPEDFSSNEGKGDGAAQVDNVMQTNDNTPVTKVSADNETNNQENTGSASFTESERAEFEALKREKKVALVNSYKDSISEEEFNKFLSQVDSFEERDLEYELLKAYKANVNNQTFKPMRAFALPEVNSNKVEDDLDAFVRKNL